MLIHNKTNAEDAIKPEAHHSSNKELLISESQILFSNSGFQTVKA